MKRITSKLKEERSKKLTAKFIFSQSSVTYRPPSGYYEEFGVWDHRGIGSRSPDVIELQEETKKQDEEKDDDMFVDDIPKHKVMLKKPKLGFLENEVISKNDEDYDSEIINSNVQKAIDKLDEEDLDVDQIMEYDDDSYPEKKFHDESDDEDADNRDVIPADNHHVFSADNHDVSAEVVRGGSNAGFMDEMRKRQRIEADDSFYYDNPDYRPSNFGESQSECGSVSNSSVYSGGENNGNAHEESTSSNYDGWRTKHGGKFYKFVSLDNRGFGRHKKML